MMSRRSGDVGYARARATTGVRRRRRTLRPAWWGPLLAAGIAFPCAAPAAPTPGGEPGSVARQVRAREGRQANGGGERGEQQPADGDRSTQAIPLNGVNLDVDLPVDPESGRVAAAADELHRQGLIGADDTLAPTGNEGRLGRFAVSRAIQEHKGIPVFAAQVVVTAEGSRIVKISGHPAPDVALDTTTPENDYPATLALAEDLLHHAVTADDEGSLVVFPTGDGYRLAWLGVVVIDGGREEAAFDAETGRVLHRVPVGVRATSGTHR